MQAKFDSNIIDVSLSLLNSFLIMQIEIKIFLIIGYVSFIILKGINLPMVIRELGIFFTNPFLGFLVLLKIPTSVGILFDIGGFLTYS